MIDCDAAVRAFVRAQAGVYALTAGRIYASLALPAGYKPSDGAALLFNVRGGNMDYSSKVLNPSYQFRSYAANEGAVRALGAALFDALNDKSGGPIKMVRLETIPTLLAEPDSGWPFLLSFYRFWIGNP